MVRKRLSPVVRVLKEINGCDFAEFVSDIAQDSLDFEPKVNDAVVFAKQPGESNVDAVRRLVSDLAMSGPALKDARSLMKRSYYGLSEVIHEIAHWQVAPPSRRCRHGFGLGQKPFASEYDGGTRLVSYDYSLYEESIASLFGILWEAHFDLDFNVTIDEHGWYSVEDATAFLCALAVNGFLKNGYPTMLCRTKKFRVIKER